MVPGRYSINILEIVKEGKLRRREEGGKEGEQREGRQEMRGEGKGWEVRVTQMLRVLEPLPFSHTHRLGPEPNSEIRAFEIPSWNVPLASAT